MVVIDSNLLHSVVEGKDKVLLSAELLSLRCYLPKGLQQSVMCHDNKLFSPQLIFKKVQALLNN